MTEDVLRTEGLTRRFGAFTAVDSVDFRLPSGELRGLIGPNGAGKTTFFDLVSGVLEPTAGRVYLHGEDVTGVPSHRLARRGMAQVRQITSVFPSLTVMENAVGAANATRRLLNPLAPAGDPEARERARTALDRVGLAGEADRPAADLSHADQTLLELALALATDPDLLLLDEPTAGLSAGETDRVTSLVREVAEDVTVLLIEHDMDVVMALADRLTVLHQGSILAEGPPDEIAEDDRVRDVYFGRGR